MPVLSRAAMDLLTPSFLLELVISARFFIGALNHGLFPFILKTHIVLLGKYALFDVISEVNCSIFRHLFALG